MQLSLKWCHSPLYLEWLSEWLRRSGFKPGPAGCAQGSRAATSTPSPPSPPTEPPRPLSWNTRLHQGPGHWDFPVLSPPPHDPSTKTPPLPYPPSPLGMGDTSPWIQHMLFINTPGWSVQLSALTFGLAPGLSSGGRHLKPLYTVISTFIPSSPPALNSTPCINCLLDNFTFLFQDRKSVV